MTAQESIDKAKAAISEVIYSELNNLQDETGMLPFAVGVDLVISRLVGGGKRLVHVNVSIRIEA